jgi:alkylation response protein AidB-like acyl-CoA dehydrogenase
MSAEPSELRDSARKVLAGQGVPAGEAATWPLVVELGWLLVAVPEELGGLGEGLAAACALYRELGASLAAAPYLPAMLAVEAVCHAAPGERHYWVELLTTGGFAGAPLAEAVLSATPHGAGKTKLTGLASAVPSADKAGHIVVWTSDDDCVALVPLDRSGVAVERRPTWDATRRLFDVRLGDVELDDSFVLARGAAAQALRRRLSTHRDFALAADSVGGAAALLDRTVEYLLTRRQFGRPLAMFQALKHRCADLKVLTEAAEALLLDGLARLGEAGGAVAAERLGQQAKSFATMAYSKVAEEALQLHGGIGMTSEHSCHLFLKRALLNVQLGRSNDRCDLDVAAGTLGEDI